MTPESIVRLLAYARRQPWDADFESHAAGGRTGRHTRDSHARHRGRGTSAMRRLASWSTSIPYRVTPLRGVARDLIFAIFGNNTGPHGVNAASVVDSICVAMVEELAPHGDPRTAPAAAIRRAAPKQAERQISR